MKEQKRDLEADLKILTAIPRNPSEPVNMVHDVVAPHALRRAIEAERQLTTTNELYDRMKNAYYEQCKESGRLRKALEEIAEYGGTDMLGKTCADVAKRALGEGDNP